MLHLDPVEGRIIGSLIEKQLTTPQQYPLTLNALVLACNQTSNRDPVVSFDEATVEAALVSLKAAGLVRFVHPSHGRSVIRYRQVFDERLALDDRRVCLVAVLLLRGSQTVGEMRTRTERMAQFESIAEVEAELSYLASLPDPLVARLDRRPGQKEERWVGLLTDEAPEAAAATGLGARRRESVPVASSSLDAWPARREQAPARGEDMAALREEVAALREEVEALREEVAARREPNL